MQINSINISMLHLKYYSQFKTAVLIYNKDCKFISESTNNKFLALLP